MRLTFNSIPFLQIIKDQGGRAKFTYQCCFKERRTGLIRCLVDHPNNWLGVLKRLISIITICVVLFGVLVVLGFFPGAGVGVNRYVVKLKEPLYKSACIFRGDSIDETHVVAENVIDLREENKFLNTKLDCKYLPSGMKIPIRISEYNILINYEKLLAENSVHVGLWGSLSRAVFLCKIQHVPAFQDCCEANVCGCIRESNPIMWISVCRLIGRVMMVLFLPIPFYARMVLYFLFEEEEVLARRRAAANAGLQDMFEFNVLQSLTPVHPVFLTAYVMYFSAGLVIAYSSVSSKTYRFHQILSDSFRDLKCSYWLAGLRMVTRNFLWPFRTLGIFGVFLGVIFWPLVMPVSIIACLIYCIPLTYLTCRMIINAINPSHTEKPDLELPGELSDDTTGMKHFEADSIMNTCRLLELDSIRRRKFNPCTIQRVLNVVLALVSIFTVYAVMLLVSECANYVLHILVFTTMGIIVNASKVLKYGALIFMVVLYSYDCYNNVYLQYLKLNKALFSEIKGRVKDISEVTMLPSYLQENRGFKSQENSDQADHETEDNLTGDVPKHWTINDLTLFVDNNDIPRIPRKLFEEVCDIEVPGSPGPVYRSLLVATGQFCFIIVFLIFVFLIVLAFGEVYKISPTNQVIATMAGGFVPFIFRRLLKPAEPDIELNSVSFKSKLEEIVVNFWQVWPMHDFKFDIEEKPESLDDGSENDDAATPPVSYLSVKEEESFKRLSVAELMDAPGKERPSSKEIMEKLVRTRSYGPADSQHVDVVIYLPYHADPTYYKVDVPSEGDYVNAEELTVLNFQHQI